MCIRTPSVSVDLPPPISGDQEISGAQVEALIKASFPSASIDLDDSRYWIPKVWDDWGILLTYVQGKLRKYVPERFDCDNFAHYVAVLCAFHYEINSCGVAEGWALGGQRHKWNIIVSMDVYGNLSLTQLESQQKEQFYAIDDPAYLPDQFYFG